MRAWRKAGFIVLVSMAAGCWLFASLDTPATVDGGDASDAGELADPQRWSSYELSSAGADGPVQDCAFDGRYMYFFASGGQAHTSLQYDTTADFRTQSSWAIYADASSASAAVVDVDGQAVYAFSSTNRPTARYDIASNAFEQPSSWTFQPFGDAAPSSTFSGATFDAVHHTVYSFANVDGGVYLAQLDTTAGAWSFSPLSFDSGVGGGTQFDGRYVYGVTQFGQYGARTFRCDTQSFDGSCEQYKTLDLNWQLMKGEVFDGRYVYWFSYTKDTLVRYDTQLAFGVDEAWSSVDLTPMTNLSAQHGVFDGRYLYMPANGGATITRYDTPGPLDASSSYEVIDLHAPLSIPAATAIQLGGACFDGQFVYFPAMSPSNTIYRFDPKRPTKAMPDGAYFGSFH